MAYISFQPKDFFNTSIWTGTGSDPLTVTGVGFQSDITWIKRRELNHHRFMDVVRGATYEMYPDLNSTSYAESQGLKSWNTDGYVLGNNAGYNANGGTYAGWTWKGGTTSVPSGGSITPSSVSYHVSGGVGVYKYTGTGSNATIAHGLGKEPSMIIVKRTDSTSQWSVYFKALGNTQHMILDTDGNSVSSANYWNNTSPTSSVFTIGSGTDVNASGGTYIAVAYCNVSGYSQSGKYTGNGNASGTFVYTGFKPSWLMIKKHGASGQWLMIDNKRGYNGSNELLYADSNEAGGSAEVVDLVSNGFKQRSTGGGNNNSGSDYFYIAFAEEPLVASNGDPATAK